METLDSFSKPSIPLKSSHKRGRELSSASHLGSASFAHNEAGTGTKRRKASNLAKAAKDDPEKLSRTIFVGNVSVKCNRDDIKRFVESGLSRPGCVESVRLRSVPIAAVPVAPGADFKMMIKAAVTQGAFNPKSASMNAYVVLKEPELVAIAGLRLNGVEFEGRHVRVDAAGEANKGGPHYDPKRTVFVGNLPYSATEEELLGAFSTGGASVEAVRVVRDKLTQVGKGFGFVLFKERSSVLAALNLDQIRCPLLGDKTLRVTRCSDSGEGGGARRTSNKLKSGERPNRKGFSGGGGGVVGKKTKVKLGKKPVGASAPNHMGIKGAEALPKARAALPQKHAIVKPSRGKKHHPKKQPHKR